MSAPCALDETTEKNKEAVHETEFISCGGTSVDHEKSDIEHSIKTEAASPKRDDEQESSDPFANEEIVINQGVDTGKECEAIKSETRDNAASTNNAKSYIVRSIKTETASPKRDDEQESSDPFANEEIVINQGVDTGKESEAIKSETRANAASTNDAVMQESRIEEIYKHLATSGSSRSEENETLTHESSFHQKPFSIEKIPDVHMTKFPEIQRFFEKIEKKINTCNICMKSLTNKSNLMAHMRIHTGERPFACNVCNKSFAKKTGLITHKRIHTGEKPFSCNVCTKSFSEKSTLLMHIRIHTGERPYACNVCHKSFTQKPHLLGHMRIHTGEKCFSCDVCAKAFAQKPHLLDHMLTHTGEKSFSCDVCSKSFTKKRNLLTHIGIHRGEKPFRCDVCANVFSKKTSLVTHMRIHTGEKPFSCNVCTKSFTEKSKLSIHMRMHTGEKPFCCDVCNKSFKQKNNLLCHLRKHTGERPFPCTVCTAAFRVKPSLLLHMRIHTGEVPFRCDVCSRSFTTKRSLLRHKCGNISRQVCCVSPESEHNDTCQDINPFIM